MTDPILLAIIIPAFKAQFLEATLTSIACQTNKNFRLYIGDDNSPEDLYSIIKNYESEISISYHRFSDNLGGISLTRHWERCIALSKDEPYIWLFSDDDILPPDAVQRFVEVLEKTDHAYPVYRFQLAIINSEGNFITENKEYIEKETGLQFTLRRLKNKVHSAAIEYIFKRAVYEANNKFVEFPLAWCSDNASWAKFAGRSYICTIPGAPVSWRTRDSLNISSSAKFNAQKFNAHLLYIRWLFEYYSREYKKGYFRKSISYYLHFVITEVLHNDRQESNSKQAYLLLQEFYGPLSAGLFMMKLKLSVILYPLFQQKNKLIRSLKNAVR